jgi:hypothetical protein
MVVCKWGRTDLTAGRQQNTKTRRARQIPISPKMREVLVRRQKAHPKDHERKPEDYVFGNEVGQRILDIETAWWEPASAPRSRTYIFMT